MSVSNPPFTTLHHILTFPFTMPSPPPMTTMEVFGAVFLLILSVIYLPVYIIAHLLMQFMYLPRTLHRHIFHPTNILQRKYFAKDAYAIVTGATDGAGKGFVEQLAARGVSFSLLVIAQAVVVLVTNLFSTGRQVADNSPTRYSGTSLFMGGLRIRSTTSLSRSKCSTPTKSSFRSG